MASFYRKVFLCHLIRVYLYESESDVCQQGYFQRTKGGFGKEPGINTEPEVI